MPSFRELRQMAREGERTKRSHFTAEEYKRHEAPTRDNQIWHARRVLNDEGAEELKRHAMVALENRCTCNTCFCCAALWVWKRRATGGM